MGRGFPVKMHKCLWFYSRHLLNAISTPPFFWYESVVIVWHRRKQQPQATKKPSAPLAIAAQQIIIIKILVMVVAVVWRLSNIRIFSTNLNVSYISCHIIRSLPHTFYLSHAHFFIRCCFSWLYHCQYHIWQWNSTSNHPDTVMYSKPRCACQTYCHNHHAPPKNTQKCSICVSNSILGTFSSLSTANSSVHKTMDTNSWEMLP